MIDERQQDKVKHLMKDIIGIVFFARLANADDWDEIHCFAVTKESFLRKYLELPNGIPSYDTISVTTMTQSNPCRKHFELAY